ncbi:MAG: hypothetical protein A2659_02240 [Candidatus Yanofskybacteria bacterium RIFCSPHIGHO2_01_FULL_44_24]|nr:MAG: hypothetical protein A2659_02240 [Candidatus Yanofskybacteria bacterium RIFCSPHIGHO2_01_FULL_44_24]
MGIKLVYNLNVRIKTRSTKFKHLNIEFSPLWVGYLDSLFLFTINKYFLINIAVIRYSRVIVAISSEHNLFPNRPI